LFFDEIRARRQEAVKAVQDAHKITDLELKKALQLGSRAIKEYLEDHKHKDQVSRPDHFEAIQWCFVHGVVLSMEREIGVFPPLLTLLISWSSQGVNAALPQADHLCLQPIRRL